jgi:Glyoxalase-like domain
LAPAALSHWAGGIARVDAEAKRLTDLGATFTGALFVDGLDQYAVGMKDPEGNEFDIN